MCSRRRIVLLVTALALGAPAATRVARAKGQPRTIPVALTALKQNDQAAGLRLKLATRDGASVSGLLERARRHPLGSQQIALDSSLGRPIVGYVSRRQFSKVRKDFWQRIGVRIPLTEPGYNVPVTFAQPTSGRAADVATVIRPGGERDIETYLGERTYAILLKPFITGGTVVNREVTRALSDYYDNLPASVRKATPKPKWTELFVRLIGNLRRAEILSATPRDLQNPYYDAFRHDEAFSRTSPTDKIQSLLGKSWRIAGFGAYPDGEYYGAPLFGQTPPRAVSTDGSWSAQVRGVRLSGELDRALAPVLDRTHPCFFTVFGQR